MQQSLLDFLNDELHSLKESGLYKTERIITSAQNATINTVENNTVINLCANNYLGLANHPDIINAAKNALEQYGYGLSSVRFICGTQIIHKLLEKKISQYLKTEETILYSSCFDANTGFFETLFSEEDAILSDALNHASIIDGIRLCKAKRFLYQNNDMDDLEQKLKQTKDCRYRIIATDGVFSMEGTFAKLDTICNLAKQYQALIMVDDSHATGIIGERGRGTPEYWNVVDKVDIITGTLGKALGGASGGFTTGRKQIIEWLRQRSRPYLFSNTLCPIITRTTLTVLTLLENDFSLKERLHQNTQFFREQLIALGFELKGSEHHPIIPVMIFDAKLSATIAEALLQQGIYVVSFSYPVVPLNQARIRIQISAAHTKQELMKAIDAFAAVGKAFKVI